MASIEISEAERRALIRCECGDGRNIPAGEANALFMRGLIAADRTLTEEGKLAVMDAQKSEHLEGGWQMYLTTVIPQAASASPQALKMMRRCFYAGALVAVDRALTAAGRAGDERAKDYWEDMALEIDRFLASDNLDLSALY